MEEGQTKRLENSKKSKIIFFSVVIPTAILMISMIYILSKISNIEISGTTSEVINSIFVIILMILFGSVGFIITPRYAYVILLKK